MTSMYRSHNFMQPYAFNGIVMCHLYKVQYNTVCRHDLLHHIRAPVGKYRYGN